MARKSPGYNDYRVATKIMSMRRLITKYPVFNGTAKAAGFDLINRFEGGVKFVAGFYLDEGDQRPARNDEINLTTPGGIAPRQNSVSFHEQPESSEKLRIMAPAIGLFAFLSLLPQSTSPLAKATARA